MDRLVTLYVLSEEEGRDPQAVEEFMARVKTVAQTELAAPFAIINVGSQPPWHYVVAEHVPGPSLADRVEQEGPMADADALAAIRGLAQTLGQCAERNVVHGELKGSDVIVHGSEVELKGPFVARTLGRICLPGGRQILSKGK